MKNKPKTVVVLPVYREEKKILERCIESILSQTYENFTLKIIVDPKASSENKKFIRNIKNRSVKVFFDPKRGSAAHRNLAVKHIAKDVKYFAFTDADCTADKLWLENLVNAIEKSSNEVGCIGGVNPSKSKGSIAKAITAAEATFMGGGGVSGQTTLQKKMTKVNSIPNCNAIYKRQCWENNKQNETLLKGQDGEFNLRLSKQGWKFLQTPNAIIYHERENSLKRYASKMYHYGKAAGKIIRMHRLAGIKRFWYSIGITGFIITILTGIIVSMASSTIAKITIGLILLYLIGSIIASFTKINKTSSWPIIPLILAIQHASYSLGFLEGIVNKK